MGFIHDIFIFLTTLASNGFSTPSISPYRSSDEGVDADSPLARKNTRPLVSKPYRVSKTPATPQVRGSPRSAKQGSIPRQCHEYVNDTTQQRCPNFEGYQGIELAECDGQDPGNHRGVGNYNVCEPCRTRVRYVDFFLVDAFVNAFAVRCAA